MRGVTCRIVRDGGRRRYLRRVTQIQPRSGRGRVGRGVYLNLQQPHAVVKLIEYAALLVVSERGLTDGSDGIAVVCADIRYVGVQTVAQCRISIARRCSTHQCLWQPHHHRAAQSQRQRQTEHNERHSRTHRVKGWRGWRIKAMLSWQCCWCASLGIVSNTAKPNAEPKKSFDFAARNSPYWTRV